MPLACAISQPKPTYLVERRYQSPYLLPVRYLSPRRYTCLPSTAPRYLAPYATLLPLRLSAPLALSLWVLESALALLRPLGAPWTLPHALELCHVRTATAVPHQHRPKCGYRSTPDSQRGEDANVPALEELGELDEEKKREAKIKEDQDDPPALRECLCAVSGTCLNRDLHTNGPPPLVTQPRFQKKKGIPSLRIVTVLGSFRATRIAIPRESTQVSSSAT
ncbi:uncharacterized protein BDZ83DRAFT_646459 [Colletotrichum acutatum]|uniref:Uncharacterized protein n=1 Tax=Glomerella acutata TaxID=27357 RepID=A0AAD8XP19_GLOAC|nr:uncharacterized protein BDZ83DRAFT_646459 [Colletotrichum acutatum]KAK1731027.1 hypothetical protein BDZ83DRAFT_646459 [Colletotrichum acutatum]